ncbi:MAG: ACP phosphodiesterase, partial [Verrucomicrobiales bacterium]|nr:ACP phosphodiesterase [Verrucomicrobiales bacterium]
CVRGRVEDSGYAGEVAEGIRLHRAVDRFTDDHPAFKVCKAMLLPERRRFAGITVDIYYDHFLTREWAVFEKEVEVGVFIERCYRVLEENVGILPPLLAGALPRMRGEDWLASYGTVEGVEETLARVARRSPKVSGMVGGGEDLRANYAGMREAFLGFFPELLEFASGGAATKNPPGRTGDRAG